MPDVVYLADAIGTQTEALIIRGLSVGVSIRRVLRLVILTGVALGLLLAPAAVPAAAVPAAAVLFGSLALALVVAIALFAARRGDGRRDGPPGTHVPARALPGLRGPVGGGPPGTS